MGVLGTAFRPADFEPKNELPPTSIIVFLAKNIDVRYPA